VADSDRLRLAAGPISWGVCEVPGWGHQLTPERVLSEMAQLGITATELGPLGWLPTDGARARQILERYGLDLVGGFVPVVVDGPQATGMGEHARRAADELARSGGEVFVAAAVQDLDWSAPVPLDDNGWKRAGDRLGEIADIATAAGLRLVIHPHVGTVLETAADVERALAHTDVPWCFDTGHLFVGGVDPVAFVRDHGDRITHAHLKDMRATIAQRLRAGEMTLMQAVQAGLFQPLGDGDARIDEVVRELHDSGYEQWLVLEQDLAITGTEPPVGEGPTIDVRKSIEFLSTQAPRKERVSK
jgi:inosose dehydratase